MRSWPVILSGLIVSLMVLAPIARLEAAGLNSQQRRELKDIRRDLRKVSTLLRRKKLDEAEQLVDKAEKRVDELAQNAGLSEKSKIVAGVKRLIALRRRAIDKQRNPGKKNNDGVSFAHNVAPILEKRCSGCHVGGSKGGLSLATFADMKKGGGSGRPLLIPGQPRRSLIMLKLITPNPKQRMPKGRRPLSKGEIQTIAAWISQGAPFDGKNETTPIGQLDTQDGSDGDKPDDKPVDVKIPKPDGDETVSFTKEIAPFMVNLCLDCHSGESPRGELSLETFEEMMRGGKSGRVLLPGNLKGSRLFRLVGGLELPRMPQDDARITRENYEDLKTWINEGATFDGDDPSTPLRELVPTEQEKRAEELAKLSSEEFVELRRKTSREQWERVLPKVEPKTFEGEQFLLFGNVSEARLEQINTWGNQQVKKLKDIFSEDAERPWNGKLAVFVMKDRYSYNEFNIIINGREAPDEMVGHSIVSPNYAQAYVVLQDIGSEGTPYSPGMKANLYDHLTGAFLKRGGGKLPAWVVRGTGLALAAKTNSDTEKFRQLRSRAKESLQGLSAAESIFKDGTFSPAGVGPVGYTIVEFMMKAGGAPNFGRFIRQLKGGSSLKEAVQAVYHADVKSLAVAYLDSMKGQGGGR